MTDLSEKIVEAAARALGEADAGPWDLIPENWKPEYRRSAETALRAVLPMVGDELVKIASAPGFIQARDTEWDAGVNFAKRFVAAALRTRLSEIMDGLK